MPKIYTVKARAHHGAKSLDLTIPASVCNEFDIIDGDIFSIEVQKVDKDIELIYKRVYKQSKSFID